MKKIISTFVISLFLIGQSAYANYERNIADDQKITVIENKLFSIIEKSGNRDKIKSIVKKRIETILSKSEKEILSINIYTKTQKSYKEYVFAYLYHSLYYNYNSTNRQLVENKYIRALMPTSDHYTVKTNTDTIYRDTYLVAKFWELNNEDDTIDFINKNIVQDIYIEKCWAYQIDQKTQGMSAGQYSIKANLEYRNEKMQSQGHTISICGQFSQTNAVTFFKRISPNILMYVNMWQDSPIVIDLETMEIKDI